MKNLRTFEDFHDDDFNTKIQPEELTPEPSMDDLEPEHATGALPPQRDLAKDIRDILEYELYVGDGSHPDSPTVYGIDEALERILKLIDGGVEGDQ